MSGQSGRSDRSQASGIYLRLRAHQTRVFISTPSTQQLGVYRRRTRSSAWRNPSTANLCFAVEA